MCLQNRLALALPFASALNLSAWAVLFPDWPAPLGLALGDAHLQEITFDTVCISMLRAMDLGIHARQAALAEINDKATVLSPRREMVLFSRFSRFPTWLLSPLFDPPCDQV